MNNINYISYLILYKISFFNLIDSMDTTRLTNEECEKAIKLCKEARPIADTPTAKVFPLISKLCPCCNKKQ